MTKYRIVGPTRPIKSTIKLSGSKSISNRVLIIKALCDGDFTIDNLSDSDDTRTLDQLLRSKQEIYDVRHAGTTFRFLTSLLSIKDGSQVLTGSDRMLQRPIGPLVDALNSLGADINYLGEEGYPPLQINTPKRELSNHVKISAEVSSQYLTSLLLIAPTLPEGLTLELKGDLVSKPYLDMTIKIMQKFGVKATWSDNTITVAPQSYVPSDFFVEADWSAASYHYSIAAISRYDVEITLEGLQEDSTQGDAAMSKIAEAFGIATTYHDRKIMVTNGHGSLESQMVEYNFIEQPDIAQTVFVMCAGVGKSGLFSGLQTLKIKETDRIAACKTELEKAQVWLSKVPARFKEGAEEYYMLDGKVSISNDTAFDTYHDHRMAMAFAPLALQKMIIINDPMVVTKSYPAFYQDLISMGFEIEEVE